MWWLAVQFPATGFNLAASGYLAAGLAVVALATGLAAVARFRRAGTTVNPVDPGQASQVVTNGVYRFSRNPMYLGLLLLLTAWALWLANLATLPVLPGFVLYMNRFQIQPEERFLALKFGEDFHRYRESVRRWL